MSTLDLDAAKARIDKAHQHVCDIAASRARWKMTIPADVENDSDLLIDDALAFGAIALAKLAEAQALLADAEKFVLNTGPWAHGPSEQQMADWVLRYREWAGLLLPNVTEVVEFRSREEERT